MQQTHSQDLLHSINNVLFVIDLSARDFIYLQSYLCEFTKIYPKAIIDLMISSQNKFLLRHKKGFQIRILQDIIKEQSAINEVYFEQGNFHKLIRQAQNKKYQAIILLDRQANIKNIELANKLNPKSYLVGTSTKIRWFNVLKKRAYNRLNLNLEITPSKNTELDNFYSMMFSNIVGKDTKIKPFLQIPKKWVIYAKLKFLKWGIDKKGKRFGRVFFFNPFDDDGNYKLELKPLLNYITKLKQNDEWNDVNFIMNVPPQRFNQVRRFFAKNSVNNLFILTADYDFFQIPAVLSLCDAVFTADGLCTDLANAFNIPVINDLSNYFYNPPQNP